MKAHISTLRDRIIRRSSGVRLRYRIVAVGFNSRGKIIGIANNMALHRLRGLHAEEVLMRKMPRSLSKILIARVNKNGEFRPIEACQICQELADRRGIKIEPWAE